MPQAQATAMPQTQATPMPQTPGVDAQGRRTVAGHLLQAEPSQIVIQDPTGQTMALDVNDQTQIWVGGERRSAADLQQGEDARVAYDNVGGRPAAVTIQVSPAAPGATPIPGTTQGNGGAVEGGRTGTGR